MDMIYARPQDYDLEHEGDDLDVSFYMRLVEQLRPRRMLELGAGSGRVALPLAEVAARLASDTANAARADRFPADFHIVGVDIAETMIQEAQRKRLEVNDEVSRRVTFLHGDLRHWRSDEPFDLIITPCSSLSHLLTLDDQIAAFSCARDNLAPSGRLVIDLTMADLPTFSESLQTPPRSTVEIDVDTQDPATGARLLRYKTTKYLPHEQRAQIRFLYDKFPDATTVDRYVSDFDCHVYYPREVELLFRCAGFEVAARYGDYYGHPFRATSRQMIFVARRI